MEGTRSTKNRSRVARRTAASPPPNFNPAPEDQTWLQGLAETIERQYEVRNLVSSHLEGATPEQTAYWRLYVTLREVRRHQMFDERLIDLLIPRSVPSAAAVLQAQRNAEARFSFLREYGLTSDDVAKLVGSRAGNRAALASRWYAERRLFRVEHNGVTYYPKFQFDDHGNVRPVISALIKVRPPRWSDWEFALWFVGANGWLRGLRPVDLIDSPDQLLEAAKHQDEESGF